MSYKADPLINSALLPTHKGETIRIVGKIQRIAGQSLMIQTSDLGTVEVVLSNGSEAPAMSGFIEIVGKVDDAGERVREFRSIALGDKLDLNLVEQCIHFQPRFPDMFAGAAD